MPAHILAVVGAARVSPRVHARFRARAGLARRGLVLLFGAALLVSVAAAQGVELLPDAPSSYTVHTGDTMWSIAGRFLRDPWRWREVWRSNGDVGNPDLIYPGDVLRLTLPEGETWSPLDTVIELAIK